MTLFQLLKEGCKVEFPSGYILQGDPSTMYIDCKVSLAGEVSSDGVRQLNKEGTRMALADARKYEQQNKQ